MCRVFDIGNGEVINGKLPKTATKLVKKWWKINKHLIRKAWNDIQNEAEFEKIPPLN
ncbi:MAG: DUF4160 domain-containing protein [Campylobacterales bacterium]|nr:DUF4160 domain-containing protein [Campylobacterales bacterium]